MDRIRGMLHRQMACSPFRFMLLEDFSFGVIADNFRVDEPTQIEAFRSELRHGYPVDGMVVLKVRSRH